MYSDVFKYVYFIHLSTFKYIPPPPHPGSWDPGVWDGAGFYSGSWEIHFGTKATCREFHDILLFSCIYPWPEPYIGSFLINIPLAR